MYLHTCLGAISDKEKQIVDYDTLYEHYFSNIFYFLFIERISKCLIKIKLPFWEVRVNVMKNTETNEMNK